MKLLIKKYGDFYKTLPLFLVGACGMYWFWWRRLPSAKPFAQPAPSTALAPSEEEMQLQEI
jgi:hypothetical protein